LGVVLVANEPSKALREFETSLRSPNRFGGLYGGQPLKRP
jgi:hypothetical protein